MSRIPAQWAGWLSSAAILALVLLGAAGPGPQQEPPADRHSRGEFMRKKLDYAQGLIEGLTLEDYDQIAKSARALKILSQASEWEVPMIPNVEQYLPYTTEFQTLCDALSENAREKDIDGATLAYVRLTLNCVNCHKYVRSVSK